MKRPVRENLCNENIFKPVVLENVESKPVRFETRKGLDGYLKKKGWTRDR